MGQAYTKYQDLPKALGVKKGDIVVLASDVLKLAFAARRNEGHFDVQKLIDAFCNEIGSEGTLMIPSYNHHLKSGQVFDRQRSRPVTGTVALVASNRKDFIRTQNPLHSFMVYGQHAEYLSRLENESSFGQDSPFAFMLEQNALFVMLGTTVSEAFTFTHFVEEKFSVAYRRYRKVRLTYIEKDLKENRTYLIYSKKRGWTMQMEPIEQLLKQHQLITQKLNGIVCQRIYAQDAYGVFENDVRHNRSRNIAHFSLKIFVSEAIKDLLRAFKLYQTSHDKISYGSDIH